MGKNKYISSFIFIIFYIVIFVFFGYYESEYIAYYPFVVLVLYLFIRILSSSANLWVIKCVCYFGVGVITLVDESKAITLVAVIALIESFDHLFENWLKRKLSVFYKWSHIFLWGHNFSDLQNAIVK